MIDEMNEALKDIPSPTPEQVAQVEEAIDDGLTPFVDFHVNVSTLTDPDAVARFIDEARKLFIVLAHEKFRGIELSTNISRRLPYDLFVPLSK